jgi:HAD superfamily hydrolase (TIGR01662 family)
MSEQDLLSIHEQMVADIEASGGRVHKIYYCTANDDAHPNRKPNPGMAREALHDFPEIDLAKSIMIGNKLSDMQFGRNAGMHTIFVQTTDPGLHSHSAIDLTFPDLPSFAKALQNT